MQALGHLRRPPPLTTIIRRGLAKPAPIVRASAGEATRRKVVKAFGAPPSIGTIADDSILLEQDYVTELPNVLIRSIGCARRIFLMNPYLSAAELEGLAYRLKALTRNEGLSAVLIAPESPQDKTTYGLTGGLPLPHFLRESRIKVEGPFLSEEPSYLVSSGYDALELYKKGEHTVKASVDYLFDSLQDFSRAVRGVEGARIPTIFVPNGEIADSAAAFLSASHVMATENSSYTIRNPSRGLTLDPIGLSYLLPRLGREHGQAAATYPGCALILALMGYEADASDMMETGLATNFFDFTNVRNIEEALVHMRPWNQQALVKKPVRYYPDPIPTEDHNRDFRNVGVGDLINAASDYRADGQDIFDTESEFDDGTFSDPSLNFGDDVPAFAYRESDLVNYAATFHKIFNGEKSAYGILERLKEVAGQDAAGEEEQEAKEVAQDFVDRMERQSPLALEVTYRLLYKGAGRNETIDDCMARERRAQTKLMGMSDFEQWARLQTKRGARKQRKEPFKLWRHKSLAHVTQDEVAEVIGG